MWSSEAEVPGSDRAERKPQRAPKEFVKGEVLAFHGEAQGGPGGFSYEMAVSPPASADEMKRALAGRSNRCDRLA
jgi:hypothetical protein